MKKTLLTGMCALGALMAVFIFAGCCCGKESAAITSGCWELELKSLAEAKRSWRKPENDITLRFRSDGQYSGCAGVNRYFGKAEWDVATHALKFGNAGVTMMTGPGREYEEAYLKMLATVDSYEIIGDDLYLKSAGRIVAEFDHESPADFMD